jgi:hypothetical protein
VAVAKIEAEQVGVGALVERPVVAARATRSISAAVAPTAAAPTAAAPTAAPPVPYGRYRHATDCGVLSI